MDSMNEHSGSEDTNGDGEGVWSADIEQCFREALLLFPPCGRRKHILQEEGGGKMYGRNELIARHIMMRTGKSRTRKQVSSHIQVLARRKAKAEAATTSSSANSAASPQSGANRPARLSGQPQPTSNEGRTSAAGQTAYVDVWFDRPIATQKIRLVEFSAFHEYRNFPATNPSSAAPPASTAGGAATPASPLLATTLGGLLAISQDQDLAGQQQPQQAQLHQPATNQSQSQNPSAAHPLASNHQLSAQFNQATNYQPNQNSNLNLNQSLNLNLNLNLSLNHQLQSSQKSIQNSSAHLNASTINNGYNGTSSHQANQSSAGSTRHFYIRLDHSQASNRPSGKLERVDICQIQDKFPEISGTEGLYQRGPSDAFFLVKFWADLSCDYEYNIDDQNSFFGFSSRFETSEPLSDITCSTKVCSYGLQVVEKVEKIYGAFNSSNGRYSFDINRSPMCEFMIQFIKKLRQLPRSAQMNSVLENFTVLQVVTCECTSEILLCLAYIFEIPPAANEQEGNNKCMREGPQCHVYKLAKD